jgi:hypothetical protein
MRFSRSQIIGAVVALALMLIVGFVRMYMVTD